MCKWATTYFLNHCYESLLPQVESLQLRAIRFRNILCCALHR